MPALAQETIMDRPAGVRKQQQTTSWYVNAYLYADDPDVLPLGQAVLGGLQFGRTRNDCYDTNPPEGDAGSGPRQTGITRGSTTARRSSSTS